MNYKIHRSLKNIINSDLWTTFKDNHAMIAGGTFERLLTGNSVNDLDVYFHSAEDVYHTVMDLRSAKYAVVGKTPRSLVLSRGKVNLPINIVYMEYFNSMDDIFALFDYDCCKAGYDFETETFHHAPLFWESLQTKTLRYNGSKYPIGALMRLTKYVSRGYMPDYSSILKLYRDLKALDTVNPDVVTQQIGGLYGCSIDLKGLTIDQIIEKLDTATSFERPPQFIENQTIEDIFEFLFTQKLLIFNGKKLIANYCGDRLVNISNPEFLPVNTPSKENELPLVEPPLIFGKWIEKTPYGYQSFYNKTFKYELGKVVTGSAGHGIYVGIEEGKRDMQYHNNLNRAFCRIRIDDLKDIMTYNHYNCIQIKKGEVIEIIDDKTSIAIQSQESGF